jgi:hypothetical protein
VPDDRYDEPSFAGGGIVAFAGGGKSEDERRKMLLDKVRRGGSGALVAQQQLRDLERGDAGIASELSSFSPQRLADLGVSRGTGAGFTSLSDVFLPDSGDGGASDEQMRPGRVTPGAGTRTPDENAQALKDYMTNATNMFGGGMGGASGAQYTPVVDNRGGPGLNALMASSVTPTLKAAPPPAPLGDRGVVGAPRSSTETTGGVPDYLKGLQATAVPGLGATQKEMLDLIGDVPAPKGTSDEAKAARKNEDLFSTLAQIGFGMAAGESPNALTNIGKAAAAAVPGMQEAIKERRKDTKEELQQQYAYELAKHGLSKDALVAAVGRTDTMTKNELAKVTALAEIKSKQIEGDKDRAVQRSGQANTSKYYDYLMNKDPKQLEQYAGIISKAKGISMDQARAEAMNVLNPGYTRGTKLTPYQAEQSARADYKIAFPMNPPPGGAEAWIRNKTAEKLAGGGDGETPNPANRIRLNAQGLPE